MQSNWLSACIFGGCVLVSVSSSILADRPTDGSKSDKDAANSSERPKNPHTSASDVNQGRNFFRVFCARCHGLDARGAKGPDLTDGVFRRARNDEELFNVVANGVPGTDMSGFGGDAETGEDEMVWQIVAFIRS